MKEIERKFLVDKELFLALKLTNGKRIAQGYIHNSEDKTVRVRTKGEKAFLTIKGATEGISRTEFEYEIPFEEARQLLSDFCPKMIDKTRFTYEFEGFCWEIDVFHQQLEGLIVAEIELPNEETTFGKPDFIEIEVSLDARYYNAVLLEKGLPGQ